MALRTLEAEHTRLLALAAIVEGSGDAIITETLDHVISSWNGGAEWIYGYSAIEALGSLASILVPLGAPDEAPEILRRIASGERIDHYQTVRRCKDGHEITVSLTASPVTDALGQIVGVSIVTRDISERVALEKDRERLFEELEMTRAELEANNAHLHAAEQLRSELIETVSHELRTPLSVILGFAKLLQTDRDPETRALYLETLETEATRLAQLVDEFLDIRRIELGLLDNAPELFDLGDVVRERVALFSAQAGRHSFVVDLPQQPSAVFGEPARIGQVVTNLLSNAVKYSPAGGEIGLKCVSRDGAVRLSVSDQGIGIPAGDRPRVFEKFFRVHSPESRGVTGTGLGLALCRELVEVHGGTIGFVSTEGQGSTFWFELVASASDLGPTRPLESRPGGNACLPARSGDGRR